jgi:PQQ-like domain
MSGSVADLVPLLAAEQVLPAADHATKTAAPAPQKKKARPESVPQAAPPRKPLTPAKKTAPAMAPVSVPSAKEPPASEADLDWGPLGDFFRVDGAGAPATSESIPPGDEAPETHEPTWAPPPVRVPSRAPTNGMSPQPAAMAAPLPTPRSARRRTWKAIGIMASTVAVLALLVYWQYQRQRAGNETQRFGQANERYRDHNFDDAATRYTALVRDFPASPNQPLYRLTAELCGLRGAVYQTQTDPAETKNALQRLREFVAAYKGDPLLERYEGDLWDTFMKLSGDLADEADEKHDPTLATSAAEALDQAALFKPPEKAAAETRVREMRDRLARLNGGITNWQRREQVLTQLKGVLDHFTFAGRQEALQAVERAGLAADPEIARLVAGMPAKHRASVTYQKGRPAKDALSPAEDQEPSLLVAPLLKAGAIESLADTRVVLTIADGVLYALEPGSSEVRWCKRVSVDSQVLPVRVARTPTSPELVLALTPDIDTLTALDAERGTVIWRHRLKGPCLGRPLVVGSRVYVATKQGAVEEIDVARGTAAGSYSLGQPLTVGGAWQSGTRLLYFPADSETVYVLDEEAKKCAAVLYTGHPAGSLRCAPVIVSAPGAGDRNPARADLVLTQEDGLDRVKLRVIPVPVADNGTIAVQWQKSIRGWSWFPPYVDRERLALATDAGVFDLYGLGTRLGEALDVFPMVPEENLGSSVSGGRQPSEGRALIVYAGAERFWVLAGGLLHKLLLTFDRQEGPKLVERPVAEPGLGSALHAAQQRTSVDGKTTLFLATQAGAGQATVVSALDARRGTIAWQRQVGLLCRGQPVRVGEQMLVEDQRGSLYLFAAAECNVPAGAGWRQAGRKLSAADATRAGPRCFLSGPDKAVTVLTALATQPPAVMVQVYQPGLDTPANSTFPQQAALGGTPGLSSDALVMPLGNGILVRQALAGGPAAPGPNWRAAHADVDAVGHVVALGKDDFLVTDGSRGLKRLHWPAGNMTEPQAATELANRILAAPLVLPADPARGTPRVCVADAANMVTLLEGDSLQVVRQWPLGGKVTAGPFLRGKGVGCIVDRRRLVWLDPDRDVPAWSYDFLADIVGEPQLAGEDLLVVADLSGHFAGFHPATGQIQGPGYTLRANVAPAAAPVFFAGRLFTPLTDRTILLLSVDHFRHPLAGMTLFW